jgi:CHRD domain/S-layer homology domain
MRRIRFSWARAALTATVAAALLGMVPAPAGAAAAPPRDTSRFACPASLPDPFMDIHGSVHEQNIRCLAAYGFINGTTSTTFSPNGIVTRGQMASFLARVIAFSGAPLDPIDQGFTDIAGSVHEDAINALADAGVIQGTSPTTFSPNNPVTRGQSASLIGRTAGEQEPAPAPDAFTDDEGSVHEDWINALAAVGIVGGVTPTLYHPAGHLTRAAAASMVARAQDFGVEAQLTIPVGGSQAIFASMSGDAEVPGPGDPNGSGTVALNSTAVDGLVCMTWDIDVGLADVPTMAHVHEGAPDEAGPIHFALPAPQMAAGEQTFETSCIPDLDQALIDELFADPAGFYVNIHTAALPDGAIRGQLSPPATPLGTLLSGSEEAPAPGEADGFGDAGLEVLADGTTICAFVFYAGTEDPMAAHIHEGAVGAAGPIVVTLRPFDVGFPVSDGCIGGLDPALVADIAANPDDYYVNVHTDLHPDGAVRGQLEQSTFLAGSLTGGAEVPGPGDADGAGEVGFDFFGDGIVCVRLTVRGISTPMAAHIHEAGAAAAGPIVVTLPTPMFNTSSECMEVDPALFAEIAANPGDYYVNVHNDDFPNGAVRGQLAPVALVQAGAAGIGSDTPSDLPRSSPHDPHRHARGGR